ncbi:MAG TPA: hypothetical protein VE777_21255 [Gaiellales bacterium]|nr:hypothetical protein [Gaiellales bacterium]
MRGKGVLAAAAATLALATAATPAFAHDCFNPTKDAHAPTAGVNYQLTGFNADGSPILVQVGSGKGIGGFVEIAAGTFGNPEPLYVHSLGADPNGREEVGGPGSSKPEHNCDGKGIDYLDDCFAG